MESQASDKRPGNSANTLTFDCESPLSMNGEVKRVARDVCQNCQFSEVVQPDEGNLPADIVVKHGRETGHNSRVEYPEE